jgi:hypothetical protein
MRSTKARADELKREPTPSLNYTVLSPTALTCIEYIDVLTAMNRRLSLGPRKTKLDTIPGA